MCVNKDNVSQAEVEEILQFLTQSEKTPLKGLLAAITVQACTEGGICVAMANAPQDGGQAGFAPPGQMEGGSVPPPGIHGGPVWQPPEQTVKPDEDDGGKSTGNYL